jgi:hypothetical protein
VKDLRQILREKELDLARVRNEVQALHLVVPLLAEEQDWLEHGLAPPASSQSLGTGTGGVHRPPGR